MLAVFEGWAGVAGLDLLYALDALERVEQAGQQEGLEVLVRGIYFCPELIGSRHFPALLLSLTTPGFAYPHSTFICPHSTYIWIHLFINHKTLSQLLLRLSSNIPKSPLTAATSL